MHTVTIFFFYEILCFVRGTCIALPDSSVLAGVIILLRRWHPSLWTAPNHGRSACVGRTPPITAWAVLVWPRPLLTLHFVTWLAGLDTWRLAFKWRPYTPAGRCMHQKIATLTILLLRTATWAMTNYINGLHTVHIVKPHTRSPKRIQPSKIPILALGAHSHV